MQPAPRFSVAAEPSSIRKWLQFSSRCRTTFSRNCGGLSVLRVIRWAPFHLTQSQSCRSSSRYDPMRRGLFREPRREREFVLTQKGIGARRRLSYGGAGALLCVFFSKRSSPPPPRDLL